MPLPESALVLAGFVLAHSAWSVSDTGDLLVPLAMLERNGKREVMRFEADTQEEAVARGKTAMATLHDVDCWAFAREGLMNESGDKIDVISVDVGAKGLATRITIIQRFRHLSKSQRFMLMGEPEVAVDGVVRDAGKAEDILKVIRRGVSQHSKVAPLWEGWHRP